MSEIKKRVKGLQRMRRMLAIIGISAVSLSCSSGSDNSPAVDEIKVNLITDKDINPNEHGHPAPLKIFIYNVKKQDVFTNAGFFEITDESNNALQDAASKVYEAILQPGETRSVMIEPDRGSEIFGFIGAYRNLNNSTWQATWTLPAKKKAWWRKIFRVPSPELKAHFQKAAVTIKKMD